MKNLITSLEDNLKELYRKAIDADEKLNELKKQGHGKFENIFTKEQNFTVEASKFMPYLEEVAEQILAVKNAGGEAEKHQAELQDIVKKIHALHNTLGNFKDALK